MALIYEVSSGDYAPYTDDDLKHPHTAKTPAEFAAMVGRTGATVMRLMGERDEARRVARTLEVDRDAARDVAMDLAQMVVCSDYMPNETERALIHTALAYPDTKETET